MKKILIISPHFPPINAADMHRVRHNLLYLEELGWQAVVLSVDGKYVDGFTDVLLSETIPSNIEVIKVKAFSTRYTRKVGLGSLSLRSLVYFFFRGNQLLKQSKFDLVFFSTTAFHVMVLGRYWKKRFNVPYILDFQDPWRNDFYLDKPKNQRPPKFLFSYNLDKIMESYTLRKANGIIAVSEGYFNLLSNRYKNINRTNFRVIPFGGETNDFKVAAKVENLQNFLNPDKINVVYVGRGGHDLSFALNAFFHAIKKGLKDYPELFSKILVTFIGTSYAPKGKGIKTIEPIAAKFGLTSYVNEITDRIPYFETLNLLKKADMLFIPGSTDNNYTASKLYPYIMATKPILAVFNEESSVLSILKETNSGETVSFNNYDNPDDIGEKTFHVLSKILKALPFKPNTDWKAFEPYSAKEMTKKQIAFFEEIVNSHHCKK